jgi:uncharacterized linocin/CFP29 family protein
MPTILKREFAPISDQAWQELDKEARRVLLGCLVARKVVDFSGPHGWEFAAVNLGRLKIAARKAPGGIAWGTRQVQPVIEVRLPFTLRQIEIDSITRGAADADLDPLQEVVAAAARFEDTAVFQGFAGGDVAGIVKSSAHKPVRLPKDAEQYPRTVAEAVKTLTSAGVEGPYALVLGSDLYFALVQSARTGYPPRKTIEQLLGGDILHTPVLTGGLVVTTRGGDFELSVGKDFSLGYAGHDRDGVELFITESFTFRVIEPRAAVVLAAAAQ